MKEFGLSESWKSTYPGAAVGLLIMTGLANPMRHAGLEERKSALEQELQSRYAGMDRATLKQLPTLKAYNDYYKRFNKTYHLQLQLESVALKGKAIPQVAALVETMFMAELKNLLLTAGHDLTTLEEPVGIKIAAGNEHYIRINGREQSLKKGDMFISDASGIMSSVIYGPDRRTQISTGTQQVLFTVYAPPGIHEQDIWNHLQDIRDLVLLITPEAETQLLQVYGTG